MNFMLWNTHAFHRRHSLKAARDWRAQESVGTCFDAKCEALFANIQVPGINFAIWGPWERGTL